jgi:SNF2 family DNA or RNA helicase
MQGELIHRVLILCPPQLIQHWCDEVSKIAGSYRQLSHRLQVVRLVAGDPKKRNSMLKSAQKKCARQGLPLLVISSDSFIKVKSSTERQKTGLFPHESECWDSVVSDEGHRAKNDESQLSRALHLKTLCRENTFRLVLTATPMQNRLEVRFKHIATRSGINDFSCLFLFKFELVHVLTRLFFSILQLLIKGVLRPSELGNVWSSVWKQG